MVADVIVKTDVLASMGHVLASIGHLYRKKPQLRIRFMITFHVCITPRSDHIFYESWPAQVRVTKKTN